MQKYKDLGLFKFASIFLKVVSLIFLILGILGAVIVSSGLLPFMPRSTGFFILIGYIFFSFFIFLVAKILDALRSIIGELNKQN